MKGLKCVCVMVRLGVAMWFADGGSLWSCGDPVDRFRSSLAVRGLCQPCTRGCKAPRLLGLTTVSGQAPASLCICTPTPRGPRRSRVLPPSFQPPSLVFPSFVPPPPAPGASPIGVASAKTNTAPTTTLRSLQGASPAPLADSEPRSQPFWVSTATPGTRGRCQRVGRPGRERRAMQNAGSRDTSVGLLGPAHT